MKITQNQKFTFEALRDGFLSLLLLVATCYLFWLALPYIGLFREIFVN